MAAPPTVTVRVRELLRHARDRAVRTGRTQQVELGEDLFVRIAPDGRRFLLFQLEGLPEEGQARAVADALGFTRPTFGWHQGETLKSLTVQDEAE
ncbi:hypothetical protein [Deinococcus pimensis]|uniref:hypothetical protein n=1 Tax=Deinococcus pimensis TaxID=309888 RepID=UPI000482E4B5|nr:hypothetical protein [Deinococcus pimensis]